MRDRMEKLIEEMLDGQIMLSEAVAEFEKLYIQSALSRHAGHLCHTAEALGIHRNTLSKRVASYSVNGRPGTRPSAKTGLLKTARRRKR